MTWKLKSFGVGKNSAGEAPPPPLESWCLAEKYPKSESCLA